MALSTSARVFRIPKQKERPPWKPGQALPSFSRLASRTQIPEGLRVARIVAEATYRICFRMAPVVAWLPEPTLARTDSKRSTRGCNQLCLSARCHEWLRPGAGFPCGRPAVDEDSSSPVWLVSFSGVIGPSLRFPGCAVLTARRQQNYITRYGPNQAKLAGSFPHCWIGENSESAGG